MKKDDCYYLGKITKAHGLKGEVQMYFDVDDQWEYEGLDAVFVEMKDGLMPLFIDDINLNKPGRVIAKLEEHDHIDDVDYLIGKPLYLPLTALPELKEDQFYFHEIKGFMVVDEVEGEIGEIRDVLEYPQQSMMEINYNGNLILIPINDEVIEKVDKTNKIIQVKLPEGLLEIYE